MCSDYCNIVQNNIVRHFGDKYSCFNIKFHWNRPGHIFFNFLFIIVFSIELYHLNGNNENFNSQFCWHAQICECSLIWIDSKGEQLLNKCWFFLTNTNIERSTPARTASSTGKAFVNRKFRPVAHSFNDCLGFSYSDQ